MSASERLLAYYGDQLLTRTGTLASVKSFGSQTSAAASAISGAVTEKSQGAKSRPGDGDLVIDPYELRSSDFSSEGEESESGSDRGNRTITDDDGTDGDDDADSEWTSASESEYGLYGAASVRGAMSVKSRASSYRSAKTPLGVLLRRDVTSEAKSRPVSSVAPRSGSRGGVAVGGGAPPARRDVTSARQRVSNASGGAASVAGLRLASVAGLGRPRGPTSRPGSVMPPSGAAAAAGTAAAAGRRISPASGLWSFRSRGAEAPGGGGEGAQRASAGGSAPSVALSARRQVVTAGSFLGSSSKDTRSGGGAGPSGDAPAARRYTDRLSGKFVRRRLMRRRGWEFDLKPEEVDFTLGRPLPDVLTRPQPTVNSEDEQEDEDEDAGAEDDDSLPAGGESPPPGPALEAIKSYAHERAPEVVWAERVRTAKRIARATGQTITVRGRLDHRRRRDLARRIQKWDNREWFASRKRTPPAPPLHPAVARVIEQWFALVDDDGSGTLDHSELLAALRASKVPVSADNINEMIELMDLDQDGVINWKEFETFFMYEFAAGKNLLSGEYVLPSGVALPFGAMIAKLKRAKLMGDLIEGGNARARWSTVADNPVALEDELGMMAAVEMAMEEMKNPALGRRRIRAAKALARLPAHLRTKSLARHLERHPEIADKLLRAASIAPLLMNTMKRTASTSSAVMKRLASQGSQGSASSMGAPSMTSQTPSAAGGASGGGSGARGGNVDLNVAAAMAAGLEWPVNGANFYNRRAKTVLRAACQRPAEALLRSQASATAANARLAAVQAAVGASAAGIATAGDEAAGAVTSTAKGQAGTGGAGSMGRMEHGNGAAGLNGTAAARAGLLGSKGSGSSRKLLSKKLARSGRLRPKGSDSGSDGDSSNSGSGRRGPRSDTSEEMLPWMVNAKQREEEERRMLRKQVSGAGGSGLGGSWNVGELGISSETDVTSGVEDETADDGVSGDEEGGEEEGASPMLKTWLRQQRRLNEHRRTKLFRDDLSARVPKPAGDAEASSAASEPLPAVPSVQEAGTSGAGVGTEADPPLSPVVAAPAGAAVPGHATRRDGPPGLARMVMERNMREASGVGASPTAAAGGDSRRPTEVDAGTAEVAPRGLAAAVPPPLVLEPSWSAAPQETATPTGAVGPSGAIGVLDPGSGSTALSSGGVRGSTAAADGKPRKPRRRMRFEDEQHPEDGAEGGVSGGGALESAFAAAAGSAAVPSAATADRTAAEGGESSPGGVTSGASRVSSTNAGIGVTSDEDEAAPGTSKRSNPNSPNLFLHGQSAAADRSAAPSPRPSSLNEDPSSPAARASPRGGLSRRHVSVLGGGAMDPSGLPFTGPTPSALAAPSLLLRASGNHPPGGADDEHVAAATTAAVGNGGRRFSNVFGGPHGVTDDKRADTAAVAAGMEGVPWLMETEPSLDAEEARELMAAMTLDVRKEDTYHVHTGHEIERPRTGDFRAALAKLRTAAPVIIHSYSLPPHPDYTGSAAAAATAALAAAAAVHPHQYSQLGGTSSLSSVATGKGSPSVLTAGAPPPLPAPASAAAAGGAPALPTMRSAMSLSGAGSLAAEHSGGSNGVAGTTGGRRSYGGTRKSNKQTVAARPNLVVEGVHTGGSAARPGSPSVPIPHTAAHRQQSDNGRSTTDAPVPASASPLRSSVHAATAGTASPVPAAGSSQADMGAAAAALQPAGGLGGSLAAEESYSSVVLMVTSSALAIADVAGAPAIDRLPDSGILAAAIATARSRSRPSSRCRTPLGGSGSGGLPGSRPMSRLGSPQRQNSVGRAASPPLRAQAPLLPPPLILPPTGMGSVAGLHESPTTAGRGAARTGSGSPSLTPLGQQPLPEAWNAHVAAMLQRATASELVAVHKSLQHARSAGNASARDGGTVSPGGLMSVGGSAAAASGGPRNESPSPLIVLQPSVEVQRILDPTKISPTHVADLLGPAGSDLPDFVPLPGAMPRLQSRYAPKRPPAPDAAVVPYTDPAVSTAAGSGAAGASTAAGDGAAPVQAEMVGDGAVAPVEAEQGAESGVLDGPDGKRGSQEGATGGADALAAPGDPAGCTVEEQEQEEQKEEEGEPSSRQPGVARRSDSDLTPARQDVVEEAQEGGEGSVRPGKDAGAVAVRDADLTNQYDGLQGGGRGGSGRGGEDEAKGEGTTEADSSGMTEVTAATSTAPMATGAGRPVTPVTEEDSESPSRAPTTDYGDLSTFLIGTSDGRTLSVSTAGVEASAEAATLAAVMVSNDLNPADAAAPLPRIDVKALLLSEYGGNLPATPMLARLEKAASTGAGPSRKPHPPASRFSLTVPTPETSGHGSAEMLVIPGPTSAPSPPPMPLNPYTGGGGGTATASAAAAGGGGGGGGAGAPSGPTGTSISGGVAQGSGFVLPFPSRLKVGLAMHPHVQPHPPASQLYPHGAPSRSVHGPPQPPQQQHQHAGSPRQSVGMGVASPTGDPMTGVVALGRAYAAPQGGPAASAGAAGESHLSDAVAARRRQARALQPLPLRAVVPQEGGGGQDRGTGPAPASFSPVPSPSVSPPPLPPGHMRAIPVGRAAALLAGHQSHSFHAGGPHREAFQQHPPQPHPPQPHPPQPHPPQPHPPQQGPQLQGPSGKGPATRASWPAPTPLQLPPLREPVSGPAGGNHPHEQGGQPLESSGAVGGSGTSPAGFLDGKEGPAGRQAVNRRGNVVSDSLPALPLRGLSHEQGLGSPPARAISIGSVAAAASGGGDGGPWPRNMPPRAYSSANVAQQVAAGGDRSVHLPLPSALAGGRAAASVSGEAEVQPSPPRNISSPSSRNAITAPLPRRAAWMNGSDPSAAAAGGAGGITGAKFRGAVSRSGSGSGSGGSADVSISGSLSGAAPGYGAVTAAAAAAAAATAFAPAAPAAAPLVAPVVSSLSDLPDIVTLLLPVPRPPVRGGPTRVRKMDY